MIYRLMACEELGYITIIQIKKHVFRKNIGKLEKQLGAKKVNKNLKIFAKNVIYAVFAVKYTVFRANLSHFACFIDTLHKMW